jgi:RNA polymerase sigma-70 factor (ECF subfamily)
MMRTLLMSQVPPNQPPATTDDEQLHREAAELLCRVANGESEAFSQLYDRFSGALLALCLTMLEGRHEAEDTLQDVFLTVWGRAKLYDPALGKAVSWLMTITRNKCLDRIRSSKRKRNAIERAREEIEAHQSAPAPGNEQDIQEHQEEIGKALCALPDKQRKAIELAFLNGYTQSEIAELLNEPLGTIKARIRRGMATMREFLDRKADSVDTNIGNSPPTGRQST